MLKIRGGQLFRCATYFHSETRTKFCFNCSENVLCCGFYLHPFGIYGLWQKKLLQLTNCRWQATVTTVQDMTVTF